MIHKSKLLLYAVMALVIQSGIVSATTITVNDNGEGDYTSIQEAIDVANSGDTILVQNGTYYEHLLLIREDNLTLLGENKETTIIDGSGIGGIIKLISVDNSTIQGFTVQNGTKPSITEGFPIIMGYTQEFLKENYSLTLLEVDVDGKEAWISLSKNGNEVDNEVIRIGDIYNYEALLSFKLDEIFSGSIKNFIEISNVNQFSEIDNTTKIVDNKSALLVPGSIGKFIPTGGGISRELEENYSLNVIDIQTIGNQRKTMLLLLKNNSVVDYDIINAGENYTYYHNGNLTLEAYIEAVFSGEGGIYLAKLSHMYQYSENNPADILLNDTVYLYFVGNARETEWILEQNYKLTAMDIDIEDKHTMAPPPITPGSQQFIEATMDINTNNYIPQLWLRLTKDGDTIEDQFVCPGDNITFYNSGSKILDLTVGIIFNGRDADLATISNVSQYNETDENDRLIQNESHMYIFEYPERDARELEKNYSITFMDIDSSTYSNPLVWVRMEKNGLLVDDQIIAQNEVYQFYNNSIKIFNASIDTIFGGRNLDLLILTNVSQYCEENGTLLLVNANWSIYSDDTELIENLNEDLVLYENYTIIPVDIDIDGTKVWMRLYKNNTMVDEIILEKRENYSYYLDSEEIISTTLETVFSGMYTKLIKLVDFCQYSEEDGTPLMDGETALLKLHFDNDEGIHIDTSSLNIIRNNNIQDVERGISLVFSINNTLINNNIIDNNYGIHLIDCSNNNSITDNNIINNSEGIRLQSSSNSNIITGNNFVNNAFYGINIQYSNHNQIYINNFINNSNNADFNSNKVSYDLWNSSDLINYQYNDSNFTDYVGNYWDDYTGSDTNSDGIGDTPYDVWVKSDDYPLIEPWGEFDTAPLITDFKLVPNNSVSTKNPAIASAYITDEDLNSVYFELYDSNGLIDTNNIMLWWYQNESGINGNYSAPPWHANAWSVTNDTIQDVVTIGYPADCPDNGILFGIFKKNNTADAEESLLWFNLTTGNLTNITRDDIERTPLSIENGVSIFGIFNLKFAINPFIEGPTFTLYTIGDPNNPKIVSIPVPTGIYQALVTANDTAGNVNVAFTDIEVDNTPPNAFAIVEYPSGTAANNGSTITLNVSANDSLGGSGIKSVTANVSAINASGLIALSKKGNYWIGSVVVNATDGNHSVNITVMDNASNVNFTEINVIMDNTPPNALAIVEYPSGTAASNGSTITLNVSANDSLGGSGINRVTANVSAINASGLIALSKKGNYWIGSVIVYATHGNHSVNITVMDYASNVNFTEINVIMDNTPPDVNNVTAQPDMVNISGTVNITASICGDKESDTENVSVEVIYPNGSLIIYQMNKTSQTSISSMNSGGGGGYGCTDYHLNFTNTAKPGRYNVTIIANDTTGNVNDTQKTSFVVAYIYTNTTIITNANNSTFIDASSVNVELELFTYDSIMGYINITRSIVNITNELEVPGIGIYIRINASTNFSNDNYSNISWVLIKVYYTNEDVSSNNLDESSLRLYWHNESSGNWTKLETNSPSWVYGSGVDTVNNYIWANVSHFSDYAVGGELEVEETTPPSNGGGGGGGGGGSSGEDFYNIVLSETDRQSVFKNSSISFRFDLEGNIVRYINFTALTSSGTVAAKVEMLNHTSTLVSVPPPNIVYNNLNIWVGNFGWATEKNMADTTVSFIVEKSWVTDNDIDETTIALYRYSDNNWNKLVTRKIAEDANSLRFEAETPGFSPFAVTGKKTMGENGGEVIIAEPTITAEKTPISTPTEKTGIPGFSLFIGLSVLLIAMRLLHKKN